MYFPTDITGMGVTIGEPSKEFLKDIADKYQSDTNTLQLAKSLSPRNIDSSPMSAHAPWKQLLSRRGISYISRLTLVQRSIAFVVVIVAENYK